MHDLLAPEWARFQVGVPQPRPGFAPNCVPFSTMSQVTHRETALTIMREGVLRAGLVSDESRLNTSRIRVTWLSPNYWTPGFRYGNVRFVYDWPTLWAGMPAYWVEVMAYGVHACRILLTDRPVDDPVLAGLVPYDSTRGDGPGWFEVAPNQHYYNSTYHSLYRVFCASQCGKRSRCLRRLDNRCETRKERIYGFLTRPIGNHHRMSRLRRN
jgi:hypothetical protein